MLCLKVGNINSVNRSCHGVVRRILDKKEGVYMRGRKWKWPDEGQSREEEEG